MKYESLSFTAFAEESLYQLTALVGTDPACYGSPVVEALVGGDPVERRHGATLGVGSAVDDSGNPGPDSGTCAHAAGLDGYKEGASVQALAAEPMPRLTQGENLGMSRRVPVDDGPVTGPGNNVAVRSCHNGTDGHFPHAVGSVRLFKRLLHEDDILRILFVRSSDRHR